MNKNTFLMITSVAAASAVFSTAARAEPKDPLVAEGFVFQKGNYPHNDPDSLIGERNLYIDYAAKNSDGTVNAVIEIPAGTNDKWETNIATGHLFWEVKGGAPRVIAYLGYPCNYGMIPRTLAADGDPLDVLVFGNIMPRGAVAPVKVVGVMFCKDDGNDNVKLLAVVPGAPMGEANSLVEIETRYPGVSSIARTWFTNYKGADGELSVKGFGDVDTAMAIVEAATFDTNALFFAAASAGSIEHSLNAENCTYKPGDYPNAVADTLVWNMNIHNDFSAKNKDGTVNAVIENPSGTNDEWEMSVETGRLFFKSKDGKPSIVQYSGYPCNFGMVPRTKTKDGGQLDILVLGDLLVRGTVAPVKVIGAVVLDDRGIIDEKLIGVILGTAFDGVTSLEKLESHFSGITSIVATWFSNYRGSQGGLLVKSFKESDAAAMILEAAIAGYSPLATDRPAFKKDRFAGRFDVTQGRRAASISVSCYFTKRQHVHLSVFTTAGEKVATLVKDVLAAGGYDFSWNTSVVRSGCYIFKLMLDDKSQTRQFPLVK